jgi:hypothetical protein
MSINSGNTVGIVNTPVYFPSKLNLTITVGQALQDALQQVLFCIENTPSKVIREIGEEAVLSIKTMQAAFQEAVYQTVDQTDRSIKETIFRIYQILKTLEEKNIPELKKLSSELGKKAVIASIAATNYPYVENISPMSIVAIKMHEFTVEVLGSFPQVGDDEFRPELTMNGSPAELKSHSNEKLEFRVSVATSFGQSDVAVGLLTIPYSTFVRFNKGYLKYWFEVRGLPEAVGSIIIESTTETIPPPVYEVSESPLFTLNSRKKHGGKDCQQDCRWDATPEKRMLLGSQEIVWIKNSGKRSFLFLNATERGVCYRAKTFHDSKHDSNSGKLSFRIRFKEYKKPDPKTVLKQTPIELEWGGSKVLKFSPKTWKMVFKPFDGAPAREFMDSNLDDPYINIVAEGDKLHISTKEVARVRHFQSMKKVEVIHQKPSKSQGQSQKISNLLSFALGVTTGYFIKSKL